MLSFNLMKKYYINVNIVHGLKKGHISVHILSQVLGTGVILYVPRQHTLLHDLFKDVAKSNDYDVCVVSVLFNTVYRAWTQQIT